MIAVCREARVHEPEFAECSGAFVVIFRQSRLTQVYPASLKNRRNNATCSNDIKLTQVATYKQSMLEAKTNRKTFNSKPRAVTA
jgi:hypothetical protein